MSRLRDLQVHLQGQSIVDGSTGWQSTHEVFTDDQDQLVVLQSAGGPEPGQRTGEEFPEVQVLARGKTRDPEPPKSKLRDIFDDLDPRTEVTMNGTDYVNVFALNAVRLIEQDDQGRPIVAQTWRLER